MRSKKYLLVLFVFLLFAACTAAPQSTLLTQAPVASQPPQATATATFTPLPTATETLTPLPSETPTPAETIPLFLTSTPGIAATLTALYSTPGFRETQAAQQTMAAATEEVQMQALSGSLLSQCPNPSDPPMQKWVDIPVMPQATAGQVVQTLIGSYYCFRAPVTVADMETFYKGQLQPPIWLMQNDSNGSMVFISLSQTGAQILTLNSGPGNKNDLIVAINVTRPIALPTQKP
jgi:hypothetical protein